MATEETLALERPQQPDEFLALIEKVVLNPDIDAEKLKVIVQLKLQLEDRQSEKAFDAALRAAHKDVTALRWDKVNREKDSRFVSYPKIDEMLKPVREKHGFTESFGVEPELPAPNTMMMYADVIHDGGHRRRYHLPMSISGEGPKGGGVMSAAQAVGNGSSLGMRYLDKLIWKIPMLVDKDDNDGNQIRKTVSDPQLGEMNKLYSKLSDARKKKALEYLKVSDLSELPASQFNKAINALTKAVNAEPPAETAGEEAKGQHWSKNATINEAQESTLVALIEEIGGSCRADFLKDNKIKKVSELSASQYQGCLAALNQQRRGV